MAATKRICKLCGQHMEETPFMTCNQCLSDMEKVKKYMRQQTQVNAMELAMQTKVPIEKITKMIKMGSIMTRRRNTNITR